MVRENIDARPLGNKSGLYILSGSTKPFNRNEIVHSGAGRFVRLNLQTLTFAEIFGMKNSNMISLTDLFDNKYNNEEILNGISIEEVDETMIRGG